MEIYSCKLGDEVFQYISLFIYLFLITDSGKI